MHAATAYGADPNTQACATDLALPGTLPVPNREAGALRHMLTQFGMILGQDASGAPRYDPLQLCADLEERLLWRGKWQEGLYPLSGLSAADRSQRDRFFAQMARFSAATVSGLV